MGAGGSGSGGGSRTTNEGPLTSHRHMNQSLLLLLLLHPTYMLSPMFDPSSLPLSLLPNKAKRRRGRGKKFSSLFWMGNWCAVRHGRLNSLRAAAAAAATTAGGLPSRGHITSFIVSFLRKVGGIAAAATVRTCGITTTGVNTEGKAGGNG